MVRCPVRRQASSEHLIRVFVDQQPPTAAVAHFIFSLPTSIDLSVNRATFKINHATSVLLPCQIYLLFCQSRQKMSRLSRSLCPPTPCDGSGRLLACCVTGEQGLSIIHELSCWLCTRYVAVNRARKWRDRHDTMGLSYEIMPESGTIGAFGSITSAAGSVRHVPHLSAPRAPPQRVPPYPAVLNASPGCP